MSKMMKLLVLFGLFLTGLAATEYDIEVNLTETLMENYNKKYRPSNDIQVNLTVFINQITSIDDSNQQVKSSINIMAEWVDSRLKWDTDKYPVGYLMVKAKSLWLPDLVVLNSASSDIFLNMNSMSLAYVDDDGVVGVLYSVPTLTTRCSMDVKKFPFDKQTCEIRLSSWAMCDFYMYVIIEQVVTEFYTENAVWSLDRKGINSSYLTEKDRFSYKDEGCYMDVASISLPITRRPLYYMINMIFPSFILTLATLTCFALPAALQFSISLTIFLNYSILSVRIASLMPIQSTDMPIVTWYLFGSMMLTLYSFLWFVLDFVLRAFSYLPGWLSFVCSKLRSLTRFVRSGCSCKRKKQITVVVFGSPKDDEADCKKESRNKKSCSKCESCEECQLKEQEKKSSDKMKAEFDLNMLCLNRIIFSVVVSTTVVFNVVCWIFIGYN